MKRGHGSRFLESALRKELDTASGMSTRVKRSREAVPHLLVTTVGGRCRYRRMTSCFDEFTNTSLARRHSYSSVRLPRAR